MGIIESTSKTWYSDMRKNGELRGYQLARITTVDKESYIIKGEADEVVAERSGRLIHNVRSPLDNPTVGDWVYVQNSADESMVIIHEILPRKTLIKRKNAGRSVEVQLIAANIDTVFIMQALDTDFNLKKIERYMVVINDSEVQPIILLSKSDLLTEGEIADRIKSITDRMPDAKVVCFSNLITEDVDKVRNMLTPGKTFCLLGSSGVGKTTLLNNLIGEEIYETQPIREKDNRGRHTTSRRQLIFLDNGSFIIDTPGMREMGVFQVESGIDNTFDEITELALECRFTDCSHRKEKECAVLTALENGGISQKRYDNFIKMLEESKANTQSIIEKKRKTRDSGKKYRSAKKFQKK